MVVVGAASFERQSFPSDSYLQASAALHSFAVNEEQTPVAGSVTSAGASPLAEQVLVELSYWHSVDWRQSNAPSSPHFMEEKEERYRWTG